MKTTEQTLQELDQAFEDHRKAMKSINNRFALSIASIITGIGIYLIIIL